MVEYLNEDGKLSREWMAKVIDPPSYGGLDRSDLDDIPSERWSDLEHEDFFDYDLELADILQEQTIRILQLRLGKKWLSGVQTEAEAHDRYHYLGAMKQKIKGMHPPEESAIVGPVRAFLLDDEQADLRPLSHRERNAIDKLITALQMRICRSRVGFRPDNFND